MTALLVLLLLPGGENLFIADASSEATYTVQLSRGELRESVDDIGLFARNMPGVVGIEALGDQTYLYRTRKDLPLAGAMETTFLIRKIVDSDSVTHYRSVDPAAENYMSCTVVVRPTAPQETSISIALRVRLAREDASDVHWLAPVFGADFISAQMTKDLDGMLAEFIERSSAEMYHRHMSAAGGSTGAD